MNQEELSCVFQGLDNKGRIYLSGIQTAANYNLLKKYNIGAVLTVAKDIILPDIKSHIPFYLQLYAHDVETQNITALFEKAFNFIESARRQTNILIHCMAGISRSPTIVASYLMRKYGQSTEKVIKHLQRKRTKVNPNRGFINQLMTYQHDLKNKQRNKSKGTQIPSPSNTLNTRANTHNKIKDNIHKILDLENIYQSSNKSNNTRLLKPKISLQQNINLSPATLDKFEQNYNSCSPIVKQQSIKNVFKHRRQKSLNDKIDLMKTSMHYVSKKDGFNAVNNDNYFNMIKDRVNNNKRIYSSKKYRNRPLSGLKNYRQQF